MAFTESFPFRQVLLIDKLKSTHAGDWDTTAQKIALYTSSVTPDMNATAANTAYGTFGSGNEVTGTGWAAGGITLTGTDVLAKTNGFYHDCADVVQDPVTVSGAAGALVYFDGLASPVADQGICVLDFEGSFSSTAAEFRITIDATNGLWHATKV